MKYQYFILFIISLIITDYATKLWIIENFALHQGLVINDFLNIVRVHNLGAAFGFLSKQDGWQVLFLSSLAITVSGILLIWLFRTPLKNSILLLGLSLIIAGALGNTLDRFLYGFVIDFIDFHYQTKHWPAFNVADIAISCGAFLLIIDTIVSDNRYQVSGNRKQVKATTK